MPTTDPLLYARHMEQRREQVDEALSELGYDALLIHSGRPGNRLFDDQHPPFRAHCPFVAMLPLPFAADCLLEFRTGQRPRLWYCQPRDFWHLPPDEPAKWWADAVDVELVDGADDWAECFSSHRALAVIGDPSVLGHMADEAALNPPALLHRLAEHRTVKTAWERDCLHRANEQAARGHRAAGRAFDAGGSELDLHLAYVAAVGQDQDQLPYSNIVALNEHAAVLHYQHRSPLPPERLYSFLLDAGADHHGYASDISRTWAQPGQGEFAALLEEMDVIQQGLCAAMRPDTSFVDLHRQAHRDIAGLLQRAGLVEMAPEDMLETGLTRYFFPHGLGHFLGVQVHDVNGLVDAGGTALPPPDSDPVLRLTRRLEPGNVVTVEPGLYFIPMLLERLRASDHSRQINWPLIETLSSCGGIRIEDNVLVTESDPINFTRQAFAGLG